MTRALLVVSAAVLVVLAGALLELRTGPRRDVVLLTIDTLRPDRLGSYGYARGTSPNIDRFRSRSVLFESAHSTSSFTPPAHASLMTSRYVADHGLLNWNSLPAANVTLAEILGEHGYRTVASVNLGLLSAQKLGQGFQVRKEEGLLRDGADIVRDGLEALRSDDSRPLFLWLHFYDVHRPYAQRADPRRYNSEGRAGVGDVEEHYNLLPEEIRERGLSQDDLRFIADRYDAGVVHMDRILAPLLEELTRPERADTLVVLTSDHGENLLEHRERVFSHDPFLYGNVTRIPLLIRFPGAGFEGGRSSALVSLVDIAPTILDVVGIPAPADFAGRSLLPVLAGDEPPRSEVYMESWGWADQKAVRSADSLVIHDLREDRTEYFDLGRDPAEQSPVEGPTGVEQQRLEELLHAFATREGAVAAPPPLDPEMRERLETLGYVQ